MSGATRLVPGACPLDCPDGCSWRVSVDGDGVARSLRGNPDHPFTQGGLCKKVNPWLTYAADPGRLLTPKRRVGPKGSGRFEEVSWDEALAEIAARLGAVIDRHGGEAIWPYVGTGNVGWIQGANGFSDARLWQRLGASGHVVTICSISGHEGLAYTTGHAATFDPEELPDAGTVVLWGSNPLVTNQHLWPFVEGARVNGARVVVIDPVRTRTASRSDWHVAPRPGTDGALALGLCHAVLRHGGADESFLAERTLGWDEFRTSLQGWTPERTAEVCGVDATEIDRLGCHLADHGPVAIKIGQGMQRHAHGGQAARAVSCLPAVLGAYDHRSGGLHYSTGPQYRFNTAAANRPDLRIAGPGRSLAMTNLGRNLTELDDPPVEALVMAGANPLVSNPDLDRVRRGLAREDLFTVVIDIFHTETADYADLVLPSTMQHEQVELNDSFAHLYVNWNEPAVEPPGQCLSHTEMLRRLAGAMGHVDPELQAGDLELAEALLDTESFRAAGVDLGHLRRDGFARLPGTTDYRPLVDGFATESGRFEFTSANAERDGHGLLPHYRPPTEGAEPRQRGRYSLVANGSDHHVNSVFAGTERVGSATSTPPIVVAAGDAARDGLDAAMVVEVGNDRGSFTTEVQIDESLRPGVATITKGWWGQGVNLTVSDADSDMGRGAIYHDNLVWIRPV